MLPFPFLLTSSLSFCKLPVVTIDFLCTFTQSYLLYNFHIFFTLTFIWTSSTFVCSRIHAPYSLSLLVSNIQRLSSFPLLTLTSFLLLLYDMSSSRTIIYNLEDTPIMLFFFSSLIVMSGILLSMTSLCLWKAHFSFLFPFWFLFRCIVCTDCLIQVCLLLLSV